MLLLCVVILDKYIYSLCELEIELITGRAHQLRSQIQFLSSETTRPKHSDAFTPTRPLTPDASHSQKGPQKEELYSVQIAGDEIYSTNYMRNVKKLNDRDDSQLQDQHDNTNSTGYSLYQNEGDRGICGDAVKADTSKLYANNRYVSSPHLALQVLSYHKLYLLYVMLCYVRMFLIVITWSIIHLIFC